MNCNKDVNVHLAFKGFIERGKDNPDGWGIGLYKTNSEQVGQNRVSVVIKEANTCTSSESFSNELNKTGIVKSNIVISHVRIASCHAANKPLIYGDNEEFAIYNSFNTHPFQRILFGKEWLFAHNGTLNGIENGGFPLEPEFQPLGGTDSEYAFCFILSELLRHAKNIGTIPTFRDVVAIINSAANRISRKGGFNMLMSNSDYVYAYSNNGRLNYVYRHPGTDGAHPDYSQIKVVDREYREMKIEELQKSDDEKAVIIATNKLTRNEPYNWKGLDQGELYIFKNGERISKEDGAVVEQPRLGDYPAIFSSRTSERKPASGVKLSLKVKPGIAGLETHLAGEKDAPYAIASDEIISKFKNRVVKLNGKAVNIRWISWNDKLIEQYSEKNRYNAKNIISPGIMNNKLIILNESARKSIGTKVDDTVELSVE
jgi:glutamine amidotransferase